MARYRIGESPENQALTSSDDFFIFIVIFGLLLGIGFAIAGIRGKQLWLTVWGSGLAFFSLAYLGYIILY